MHCVILMPVETTEYNKRIGVIFQNETELNLNYQSSSWLTHLSGPVHVGIVCSIRLLIVLLLQK